MSSDERGDSVPVEGKTSGNSNSNQVDDLSDFIKHPLQTSWTLFYKDPDVPTKNWQEAVKTVLAFNTVEDFWALYHHITQFSQLKKGSDYSLFRGGKDDKTSIRPEWEDVHNREGGVWKFKLPANFAVTAVDAVVQEMLMSCVGEMYGDYSESVNGIVASTRKHEYRFEVWTGNCERDTMLGIGQKICDFLPPNHRIPLQFYSNKVAAS